MDARDSSSELRQLRREVQELLRTAGDLLRRIEALESAPHAETPTPPRMERPKPVPPPVGEVLFTTPPAAPRAPAPVVEKPASVVPPPPPSRPPEPAAARVVKPAAESKRDWEFYLGSYLGPRLAIVVLATAAVFFLVWAVGKWGPPVRVAIGYGVTVTLLVLGRLAEKKYPDYARVLYSGGFLLSYFVTYAAHYIPAARVIDNPYLALRLLALVVAAWAVAAQWRKSRTMAVLVLAMAHFTIFLSGPGPRSAFAILLLSGAAAFFLLWNRWYYIAAIGLVGSYVNQTLWMIHNAGRNLPTDFWITLGFLVAHFAVFALADLFAREEMRRQVVPTWFRNLFLTFNSAAFLILSSALVANFSFTQGHYDVLYFTFAGVLVALGLAYLRVREGDPLYNAYLTKGVAVFTLGLALRYDGSSLSAWLAVESLALLVSARRSGLLVTRLLALALAAATFGHGWVTLSTMAHTSYGADGYSGRVFRMGLTVLSLLAAALLYERTDWDMRSPRGSRLSPDARAPLWWLGFASEPPSPGDKRPVEGLLFAYAYAVAAYVLYLAGAFVLVNAGDRVLAIALPALAFTIAAASIGSKPYGLLGILFVAASLAVGTVEFYAVSLVEGVRASLSTVPLAVMTLQALAITALFSERVLGKHREGLVFHRTPVSPYFLYGVTCWLLGLLLMREFEGAAGVVAMMTAAAVLAVGTLWLHPQALGAVSTGLLLWALVLFVRATPKEAVGTPWEVAGWVLVLLPLLAERFYVRVVRRGLNPFAWALVTIAWAAIEYYLFQRVETAWFFFSTAAVGYAFLAHALAFRCLPSVVWSLVAVALASGLTIFRTYTVGGFHPLPTAPLVAAYLACAAYWILLERLQRFGVERMKMPPSASIEGVPVGVATLLLVLMLARIPAIREHWLTVSWAVLAFALFGLAVAFRRRPYRYAALAVIALALGRAYVVDAFRLSGLTRVAAFAVLSLVLLLVGFGYLKAMEFLRGMDRRDGGGNDPGPPGEPI